VEVLKRVEQLGGVEGAERGPHAGLVGEGPELAAGDVLGDDVQAVRVVERVRQLDDERVLGDGEHVLLHERLRLLLVPLDLLLLDHLRHERAWVVAEQCCARI
jgi:hypothetical protein